MAWALGMWATFSLGASSPTTPLPPCDASDADPWVVRTSREILAEDGLIAFATETFGASIACEGEVTDVFDGESFGTVTLTFPGGVAFTYDTMPPRMMASTLRAEEGFDDAEAVLAALREYADALGFSIVWAAGSARVEGGEESQQFWDPDLALNASATITRDEGDGTLLAVRLSRAP